MVTKNVLNENYFFIMEIFFFKIFIDFPPKIFGENRKMLFELEKKSELKKIDTISM